jgi:hypothetical protein
LLLDNTVSMQGDEERVEINEKKKEREELVTT